MRALIITLSIFTFSISSHAAPGDDNSRINMEVDQLSCAYGMEWMDVNLQIDNEIYELSPNCEFKFNKTIVTSKGATCTVKSDMCFNFKDVSDITVKCDFGESYTSKFYCDN